MKILETSIPGCLLIEHLRFDDQRGSFRELYVQQRYQAIGITEPLVQDNLSISAKGVLRGMHFQRLQPQGKLVTVLSGSIYDVMVDIRPDSVTFGQWQAITLSADMPQQLWIPPGFAHGFQALEDNSLVFYKTSSYYNPNDETSFNAFDPTLNIPWPIKNAILSSKDSQAPSYPQVSGTGMSYPQVSGTGMRSYLSD
jgi:dTDP-4-dehydrorhamnose 3,5-epimerase